MTRRDAAAIFLLIALGAAVSSYFLFSSKALFPFHTGAVQPWSVSAPAWVADEPVNPNVGDKFNIIYPDMSLTRELYSTGHMPLWNPYNYAGLPHQANPLTATCYPVNALRGVVHPVRFFGVSLGIHLFLAAAFTFLYLRLLGTRPGAALAGGLTFALSGWMAVHVHHSYFVNTLTWLPLALAAVEMVLQRRARWALMVLALSIAMMFLAGFPQTAVISCYVLLAYAVIGLVRVEREHDFQTAFTHAMFMAGFAAVGLLLAGIQLGPTAEFTLEAGHSGQSIETLKHDALKPAALLNLIIPDFFGNPQWHQRPQDNFFALWLLADGDAQAPLSNNYSERSFFVGILALVLALGAPLWRRDRIVWTLWGMTVVAVAAALGTPVFDVLGRLPGLGFGSPMRFTQVAAFTLPVLFALSLDRLAGLVGELRRDRRRLMLVAGLAILVPATLVVGFTWAAPETAASVLTDGLVALGADDTVGAGEAPIEQKREAMLPQLRILRRGLTAALIFAAASIAALLLLADPRRSIRLRLAAATVVVVVELLWYGVRFNLPVRLEGLYETPSSGIEFLQRNLGDARFIRFGLADTYTFFVPNAPLVYRLRDAQGYRALTPKTYLEFMKTLEPNPVDYGLPNLGEVASLTRPQLDLLRVKYVVSARPVADCPLPRVYPPADHRGRSDMFIYENADILPRAFLVHQVNVMPAADTLTEFAALEPGAANPFRKEVWLEELVRGMRSRYPEPTKPETVRIVTDEPGRIVIDVEAEAEGLLVLSEQYDDGWRVTAAPFPEEAPLRRVRVQRADHTLMAVPVEKGTTRIEMRYEPTELRWGAFFSGLSAIFILLVPLFGVFATPGGAYLRRWQWRGPQSKEQSRPTGDGV